LEKDSFHFTLSIQEGKLLRKGSREDPSCKRYTSFWRRRKKALKEKEESYSF